MNKTVTINISGIIFHIEEEAYEKLSKYLNTIKGYFSKADGGNEIMSDIEARIAEMLQGKTSAVKQVVLMSDVDYVMDSMGKPEEFAGDDNTNNQQAETAEATQQENINNESVKKRLYRDGDSKVLGGVCSGIGHYFGFDPVWLRIALACLLFFAGTGVLLYIILWIAIPEAKTVSEKFAMKGEKADINNISKAVKEEAEQLKKRMEKYGQEFSTYAKNNSNVPRNAFEKFVDFIGDVLRNVGRVFLKIIAIFMLLLGIILFLGLFSSVFGLSLADSSNGGDWIDMILLDGKDFYLGIIGIALCAGIPIVMMIYAGVKILFKINYHNRWVNIAAGVVWLVGLSLCLFVGIRTGSDFNKTAKIRESVTVAPYETLVLKMHQMPVVSHEINISDADLDNDEDVIEVRRKIKKKIGRVYDDNYVLGKRKEGSYLLGHAQLNIIKSQTDKFEIVIVKEAKGGEKLTASERAKNISYKIVQTDSVINFDNLFEVANADKFRAQDVTVILKVPVGKTIFMDKSLENLIYDIENVTNTYDGDMLNRRWIMTDNGLKCVDCDGLEENDASNTSASESDEDNEISNSSSKENINITINGVDIKDKNSSVKIDDNGIHITDKKDNIKIDKDGVHIETKK